MERPSKHIPVSDHAALRRRSAGSRRWQLFVLPVILAGIVVGTGLSISRHAGAVPGPGANARPFAWPLRLTGRVNVLLIGIDATINEKRQVEPVSRSDTLMLLSFDPQHNHLSVLSIPRDSFMVISGVGPEKINAAYAAGGPRLTLRTVEDLLGVPVPFYIKMGATSFARIVDAMGGIDIDVEKDMTYTDQWADLYIDLKKGRQHLTGDQVNQYIHYRNDTESDLGRIRRQQQVLLTVFQKLKSPAMILWAPRLLQAFVTHSQTNLSLSELMSLGLWTTHLSPTSIQTATLPGLVGLMYVYLDEAQTRQLVAEMLLGVKTEALASTAVEVLNGSGVPGLARQVAQRLERLGLRIVRVEKAPQLAQTTTVIDRTGRPDVASALADLLGHKPVTYEPSSVADITIIVAKDLLARYPVEVTHLEK